MFLRKQDPLAKLRSDPCTGRLQNLNTLHQTQPRVLRLNWIFDAVRHFGAPAAMEVAKLAAHSPRDSVSRSASAATTRASPRATDPHRLRFRARQQDLHPLIPRRRSRRSRAKDPPTPSKYLKVVRIGHGIAAMHDESLMDLLTERRIPLELCPTSNLRTGALARQLHRANDPSLTITDHPLRMFFNRGVPVTLSTDDPAMFETTLLDEYNLAAQAGFTPAEIVRLAQASFEHALLPAARKQNYISTLKNSVARSTPNSSGSLL